MKNFFLAFDKLKKYICFVLFAVALLLMCFPCHNNLILGFTTPYFFKFITYFYSMANLMVTPYSNAVYGFAVCFAFACVFFISFLVLSIWFLIRLFKGKTAPFIIPLTFGLICFSLLQVQDNIQKFECTATYIIFCVIFAIYFIGFIIRIVYNQKERFNAVFNNINKVRSHKSKSERIEELERQNEEMQKRLDDLERKNQ